MCERCGNTIAEHSSNVRADALDPTAVGQIGKEHGRRRQRLWELDVNLHCSIVGTCLTLGDLHRIAGRLKLTMPAGTADYAVHGTFVRWAGNPGPVAKQLHRMLERRHAAAIRMAHQATNAHDLAEYWQRRLDSGDVPGPYWALLTHPAADIDLTWRAFGDVHMLSHLVGAANRADIRRLKSLETERDQLSQDLALAKRRLAEHEADARRMVRAHAAELSALSRRLQETEIAARTAEQRARTIAVEPHHGSDPLADTSQPTPPSKGELRATRRDTRQQREIERLRETLEDQDARLNTLMTECTALEAALCSALAPTAESPEDSASPEHSTPIDLTGLRIVYIGGRGSIIPHIRALVERSNGAFLHHDGGIEDSGPRLEAILTQGDAVFCPVDCVSHRACRRAKELCRQGSKAFVPLRSASLSAIAGGLRTLAGAEGGLASSPDPHSGTLSEQ